MVNKLQRFLPQVAKAELPGPDDERATAKGGWQFMPLLLIISKANGPHPYQPGATPQDPRRPPIQGLKARTIPFPCHPMPIATMNLLCDAGRTRSFAGHLAPAHPCDSRTIGRTQSNKGG
jgi:hypothetical protein